MSGMFLFETQCSLLT